MPWTLATWNVNSLKVRLPHLLDWLAAQKPDIVALQETKLADEVFPYDDLAAAGYASIASGQKTYNGVAVLTRVPRAASMDDVVTGIPGFPDEQKRILAVTVGDVRVVDLYVPNGQSVGSDKYAYKLAWFESLTRWLKEELVRHPRLAVLGDFNVAPEDRDVHDPKAWAGSVLFSEPERAALQAVMAAGLTDSFRLFEQPERSFSWWDYRMLSFQKKRGLRIDHILVSPALARECTGCVIDTAPRRLERPSDHAPVIATFRE
ncbi:MAG: exodeoxyribonuclease III [Candidatus Eisenbacteria bacterium]